MTYCILKYGWGNVKWVKLLTIYYLHTNYTRLIILLIKLLVSVLVINFEIRFFLVFGRLFFILFNLNLVLLQNLKELLHIWGGHENMALCQGQMILL
jgi:hypothetical protein